MYSPRSTCRALVVLSTIVLPTAACGETIDPSGDGFGDSASFTAGNTATETGQMPDVGVGELDPGECIADPKTNVFGYKYQCGGSFVAHLSFTYEGDPYTIYIPTAALTGFGDGHESYEQTKVMACCGEFDRELPIYDQPSVYPENCLLDFRQQACSSMATGLAALINDGTVPALYESKATAIQNYIAQHSGDCIEALLTDSDDSPMVLMASWSLPSDGPWSPQLEDVQVVIDSAVVTNMYLPEAPEPCDSLHDNDGEVFPAKPTPLTNIYDITLEDADGGIFGPASITGTTAFASLSTACVDPFCSLATFSTDADIFAIDVMKLQVDGTLRITDGTQTELISNARLELYSQTHGRITGGDRQPILHTIDAGAAQFIVVGQAAGEWVTIPVLTSTPIVAHETAGAWSLDAFELQYTDDMGSTWTLRVGASQWL